MIPTGIVKRLAAQAAIFGAMVMDPVQGLFSQMSQGVDFCEVACEPNSSNLTQRTEHEQAQFEQRQNRDMKRADEVSQGVCSALEHGQSFAWEWPTGAAKGWRARCIS